MASFVRAMMGICWDKEDKGVKEKNTGLSITSGIIISSNRLGIIDQNSLTG
jgi:hypothetical protein